jgi:hypothetical protein
MKCAKCQSENRVGNLNEARVHAEQAVNLGQKNHEKYCEGVSRLQLGKTIGKMKEPRIDEAVRLQEPLRYLGGLHDGGIAFSEGA